MVPNVLDLSEPSIMSLAVGHIKSNAVPRFGDFKGALTEPNPAYGGLKWADAGPE